MSKLFVPTRKEDPADAEVISHKLLLRAGYIRMIARGIYSLLPLGWRSVRKIEQIIREEMDRAGAQAPPSRACRGVLWLRARACSRTGDGARNRRFGEASQRTLGQRRRQ